MSDKKKKTSLEEEISKRRKEIEQKINPDKVIENDSNEPLSHEEPIELKKPEELNGLNELKDINDSEIEIPITISDEASTPHSIDSTHSAPEKHSALMTDFDLHLFSNGTFYKVYEKFGSHITKIDGNDGVQFTTWAPNADRISVIGTFNGWTEGKNEMAKLNEAGVWSLFIPGLKEGDVYKYSIRSQVDGQYRRKSDPYCFRSEHRPKNASIVHDINKYKWNDDEWMESRSYGDFRTRGSVDFRTRGGHPLSKTTPINQTFNERPINIYELHLGSWKRDYDNPDFKNEWGYLSYPQLAHELVDYVRKMGYTHIELMPVMEHPLDISWGYQVTCYYAPTSRFGSPEDFMYFVDHCHQNGVGVILDWVPAHFPADEHAMAFFDGKQIYAYESWKKGFQKDWNTYIFDYGRHEVQNFLIGSALFWLEKYHADGLRVDAVASMLYLDYSREQGEWEPNIHGGRENLEAIEFIKHLNDVVHKYHPGTMMIAEESTAWPGVSHPVSEAGLGFDMKWNMGWMNDILLYFSKDPVHRKFHQGKITFSLWYAFSENFVLPISHDEVVHGKKSLLEKMPGDNWQKFANLRLFLGFMFGHPGKKLNFMTIDIAQYNEWNSEVMLERNILQLELNKKYNIYAADLFDLYKNNPAFHEVDFDPKGFQWIDFSDSLHSILSFIRLSKDEKEILLFTFNMTPSVRNDYHIGVPKPGYWKEILNSDAEIYGGSGIGNMGGKQSEPIPVKQWENSLNLTLPPLAVNIFKYEGIIKNDEIIVEDDIDKLYTETGGGD